MTPDVAMPFAGAILVWSGHWPCFETARVPPASLVLGRDLLYELIDAVTDDRISSTHVRVARADRRLVVTDLASRNGTFVGGHALVDREVTVTPPAVLRTGRSVWVLVADLRRFEHVPLTRRGRLVVGGSLDATCRALDTAASNESHVVLHGSLTVSRELAKSYTAKIGGKFAVFDDDNRKHGLEKVLDRAAARTLILELQAELAPRDAATLETWLETDLRVVTLAKEHRWLRVLPANVVARLEEQRIEIPRWRCDELSTTAYDIVQQVAPGARVHSTLIERCLLERVDEDVLWQDFRSSVTEWKSSGKDSLRGEDLEIEDPAAAHHAVIMTARRVQRLLRARAPSTAPVSDQPDDASWAYRQLCVDGSCFGVIAPDGRCRVCGKPAPLEPGTPYR